MTDQLRQAAQQALEALIDAANVLSAPMFADAVAALRTALEQQAEPVQEQKYEKRIAPYSTTLSMLLNTAPPQQQAEPPPQRQWQGLTDEDLEFWTSELGKGELGRGVIRAVADHLKERNT